MNGLGRRLYAVLAVALASLASVASLLTVATVAVATVVVVVASSVEAASLALAALAVVEVLLSSLLLGISAVFASRRNGELFLGVVRLLVRAENKGVGAVQAVDGHILASGCRHNFRSLRWSLIRFGLLLLILTRSFDLVTHARSCEVCSRRKNQS